MASRSHSRKSKRGGLGLSPGERRAWSLLAGATLLIGGVGFVAWRNSNKLVPAKPVEPQLAEIDQDAPVDLTPRAGLEVATKIEKKDGSRRILLKLAGGEAVLTLGPSEPGAGGKGEGTLVAETAEKGAVFISAFARWFNGVLPPPRSQRSTLAPVSVKYVRLGVATSQAPEALRLTISNGRSGGEIFFNIFPNGTRATFVERFAETRDQLLAAMAEGLRDGPKPPRTKVSDPHLSSEAPLTTAVRLLDAPAQVAACGERGIFLAVREATGSKILEVSDPSKPPRTVASFGGAIEAMRAAASGKQIAVALTEASSSDTREIRILDVVTGAPAPLPSTDDFRLTDLPVWSSAAMAVEGHLASTPGERITRAFDSSHSLGSTQGVHRFRPVRFEGDKLVLMRWEQLPSPHRQTAIWTIGSDPVIKESIPYGTPDGLFSFTVRDGTIIGKGRSFATTDIDDQSAVRDLDNAPPIWLGTHLLGLPSDIALALDVETMMLRPLVANPAAKATLVCVTGDGRHAALLSREGAAFSADLTVQLPQ